MKPALDDREFAFCSLAPEAAGPLLSRAWGTANEAEGVAVGRGVRSANGGRESSNRSGLPRRFFMNILGCRSQRDRRSLLEFD